MLNFDDWILLIASLLLYKWHPIQQKKYSFPLSSLIIPQFRDFPQQSIIAGIDARSQCLISSLVIVASNRNQYISHNKIQPSIVIIIFFVLKIYLQTCFYSVNGVQSCFNNNSSCTSCNNTLCKIPSGSSERLK